MAQSNLERRLISEGLSPPRKPLTEAQAMAERCEFAATASGVVPQERRRVLLEAAAFIRAAHGLAAKAGERAS